MNYIDVTQNMHSHCVKNHTVVITNREGIQGIPGNDGKTPIIGNNGNWFVDGVDTGIVARGEHGNDGFSPYISKETGNWVDANGDTGISAGGGGESIKELLFFYSANHFPQVGVSNIVYVDNTNTKMYKWDESKQGYVLYNDDTEEIIYCGGAFDA
jgi:hypothetical protein